MSRRVRALLVALAVAMTGQGAGAQEAACVALGRVAVDSIAKRFIPEHALKHYQMRNLLTVDSLLVARCARPDTVRRVDTLRVVYFDTTFVPSPPDTVWLPAVPDSVLEPPPVVPESVTVGFSYTTTALWPSGRTGALVTGAGTLCASVLVDGVLHLGDRAVSATIVSHDSVMFVARPEREASGLRALCDPIWRANGLELRRATPIWPVVWSSQVVILVDAPVAIPTAEAVIP